MLARCDPRRKRPASVVAGDRPIKEGGRDFPRPPSKAQICVKRLARRVEVDQLGNIIALHPAERAVRIAGSHDLVVGAKNELRRLDDLTAVFPPRSQLIGNFTADFEADREIDLVGHFLCLVDRVDARRNDRNAKLIEFCLLFCEAD